LAVYVRVPGGVSEARQGSKDRASAEAIEGDHEHLAEHIMALQSLGVAHIQLVVDPITAESIEWLGGVLAILDNH
ncbi:MAG: hypothetical protein ABFR95_00185, partial [Actinomycetota bacterium]